jgi:CBS domain-containing protein
MLTVKEIMTTELITFTPDATIREAMETLTTNHLSGAPVVAGRHVVGVISVNDLLSFIVNAPEIDESNTRETVAEVWEEPVQDEAGEDYDEIAISDDIADEWVQNSDGIIDDASPEGNALLDQHTVEEAMTARVVSVRPETSVRNAAALMRKLGVHRVLVMEGRKLKGIISALDIARMVGERGINGRTGVRLAPCPPDRSPWIDI